MTIKTQAKGINVSKKSKKFPQFSSGFREEKPDVKILERRQPWRLCVGKWDLPSKSRGSSKVSAVAAKLADAPSTLSALTLEPPAPSVSLDQWCLGNGTPRISVATGDRALRSAGCLPKQINPHGHKATHSHLGPKPTHLFFLLKSQMDTARTILMPRTPARATERAMPVEG